MQIICMFVYSRTQRALLQCRRYVYHDTTTGWRRLIGSPKLQIIFHKRATKYRALLRKLTYKDKGSYESSPPCSDDALRAYISCVLMYKHIVCIFVYTRTQLALLQLWQCHKYAYHDTTGDDLLRACISCVLMYTYIIYIFVYTRTQLSLLQLWQRHRYIYHDTTGEKVLRAYHFFFSDVQTHRLYICVYQDTTGTTATLAMWYIYITTLLATQCCVHIFLVS